MSQHLQVAENNTEMCAGTGKEVTVLGESHVFFVMEVSKTRKLRLKFVLVQKEPWSVDD